MKKIDDSLFKATMKQLASGVTVITVCGQECGESGIHAMTATAFMPLSLDPPLVLVAIEKRNDTHDKLVAARCFGVSLLAERQAALSTRFARKDPDRYRFDDVDCFRGPNGAVFLNGCAAAIEATVVQQIGAGDHTIFIGEIAWMKHVREVKPLVYYQGAYQKVTPIEAA